MRAEKLLHKIIGKSCQIDKRIIRTVIEAAITVGRYKKLSIFGIARTFPRTTAKVKNLIKCVDRLFGNKTLHNKRHLVYKKMIDWIIKNNPRPIIAIDWSGLTRCGEFHFLRAAVTAGGRTITLYEKSYHISKYTKHKEHEKFLLSIRALLPKSCVPIIVTDAGFRNNWFKLIRSFGWDFIGRVRNNTQCKGLQGKWNPIKDLYKVAKTKAKFLGQFELAKTNSLICNLYLIKQKKLYRKKCNLLGRKVLCSSSLKHAKRENEPWLIAASIDPETITANQVIKIYKKRMQIEESFRDIKNRRNGLCLRECRSRGEKRLDIALLIGAVAIFMLWIIGMVAKQKHRHRDYQSNSIKSHSVLSVISIGWQALERKLAFTWPDVRKALQETASCTII